MKNLWSHLAQSGEMTPALSGLLLASTKVQEKIGLSQIQENVDQIQDVAIARLRS